MIPVSAVLVTKDEEKNIGEALESVRGFEEIIVVDSFSRDRTVEICRRYTDKVFQHEWMGYARQKQMAVDLAGGKWVLILDADERVTPGLGREIEEKIKEDRNAGFYIPRKNFFLGRWIRHGGWWPDYSLRLFRKNSGRIQQREVHEKVVVDGPVGRLREPMEHYTYEALSDYLKKMGTYSSLSADEILKNTPRPSTVVLILKMFAGPPLTFLKMFFLRLGFMDGFHGFILAVLYGFYTFLKYAKAWEKKTG